ncbi:MAG: cellobiose phosphorylase, partial [Desulfocucumaceae bacterium]
IEEHYARPKKFAQKPLPLFLEGQMHALRLSQNPGEAADLYKATRKSPLFDRKLKMYKVTASLESMPEEIGRCRVFTPGWLENESIWLHMEYKYILELLKTGLVKEFYSEFKNVLIPFQDPQRYGRSILENSSFLVSSAFPDNKLHGNGFVARLSGSTAEFLQIWLVMNIGVKPFALDENGRLNLCFKPNLAGWLFDKKGTYVFNFLGRIPVTYHNPKRKDTFGKNAAKIKKIQLFEKEVPIEISSATIPSPLAEKVRSRQISKINIYLE